LDENPEYEALSYTWGNATSQSKMRMNGKIVSVTQNLANALSDIRSSDSSRILWVDALCIDQNDLKERNHQVRQMGRIYHNAKQVLVWLGRPEVSTTLKRTNGLLGLIDSFNAGTYSLGLGNNPLQNPEHWKKWHDLAILCELPYWNRLWIVQEIGLAFNLNVYYGQSCVDWKAFDRLREQLVMALRSELCPQSMLTIVKTILESMPARLEEQRTRQRPEWLKKLHDDLLRVHDSVKSAFTAASILYRLREAALQLRSQERDILACRIDGKVLLRDSDLSLLDQTQYQSLHTANFATIENSTKNWHFDSMVTQEIATLPTCLEHVKDQQRDESDKTFLSRINSLKCIFESYEVERLNFVYNIHFEENEHPKAGDNGNFGRLIQMKDEVLWFFQRYRSLLHDLSKLPDQLQQYRSKQLPAFRLQTLLETCERSLCQEPRDKVYGLLGLASDVDNGVISVDYSKSMFEIFVDVMMHHELSQDNEKSMRINLVGFSQLVQRSLAGPFSTMVTLQTDAPDLINNNASMRKFKIWGFLKGPILPLESTQSLARSEDSIEQERMVILKNYFRGAVDDSRLGDEISRKLRRLRAADKERLMPFYPKVSHSTNTALSALNHPQLFSESSGIFGLAPSYIREDDLLCQFANCDVACILRLVEDNYNLIGRAIVAKRFGKEEQRVSRSSPEVFQYSVPEPKDLEEKNRVELDVDASILQALTCPTSKEQSEYSFTLPQL